MTIAFQCSGCGATLRVPDTMAGRRGKCPKCAAVNSIPGGEGQLQTAPSAPKSAAARAPKEAPPPEPADEGEEAGAEAEPRPKRKAAKKRGSRTLLFVGLGCGGLLLLTCLGVGAGVGIWWFTSSPIGDELTYMPGNCEVLASVRIDQLLASGAYKQLENEVPQVKQAMAVAEAEKEIGLSLSNVERLVVGGALGGRDEPVVAVRTKQPVKADELAAKIKGKSFTASKEGSYTLYETGGVHGSAFCVAKKNLVLFGTGAALRVVLRRNKKPDIPENLSAAMKEMDFKQTVTVAVAPLRTSSTPTPPFGGRGGLPFGGPLAMGPPPGTEWAVLQAKVGTDVSVNVVVMCKSNAEAADVKKKLDEATTQLRQLPMVPKDLSSSIDIKASVSGRKVTATTDIKVAPLIQSIKKMAGPMMK
jgi:phage FluMu protein Com